MMEVTRALGQLKREGTRPKRTLVFCSWDGEEVTLTGSTEWGEQFSQELKQKLVAYLNVDSAASGPNLDLSAVGSLAPMVVELTKELARSLGGIAVRRLAQAPGEDGGARERDAARSGAGHDQDRKRLRPHRLHQLPGPARRRDGLRRAVRRLSLRLRRSLLDDALRRPGLQIPRAHGAALGHDGPAPGERGRAAPRLRRLRRRASRVHPRLDEIPGLAANVAVKDLVTRTTRDAGSGAPPQPADRKRACRRDAHPRRRQPGEPEDPRLRGELGEPGRDPGPALVQAPALRAALHIRRHDVARDHRGRRSGRLGRGPPAGRAGGRGHREEHGAPRERRRRPRVVRGARRLPRGAAAGDPGGLRRADGHLRGERRHRRVRSPSTPTPPTRRSASSRCRSWPRCCSG